MVFLFFWQIHENTEPESYDVRLVMHAEKTLFAFIVQDATKTKGYYLTLHPDAVFPQLP